MSAIADFRLIETSKLNELRDNAEIKTEKKLFSKKTIDDYWDYLNANSKKLKDFADKEVCDTKTLNYPLQKITSYCIQDKK